MALIISIPNQGRQDILIILGPDNIERIKEKDPFELKVFEMPSVAQVGVIAISYASDAELTQLEQLGRSGKKDEIIKQCFSGFKYRPEMGDHDLGPQRFT